MVSPYKERFIAQAGKEVPLDYFLYSCFEAENMIRDLQKKAGGKDKVDFRYPDLASLASGLVAGDALDASEWERKLATLLLWHGEREPSLLENITVDYERVSSVTAAFAGFYTDFRELYAQVAGDSLPVFDAEQGLAPIWQVTMKLIQTKAPRTAGLITQFFAWTHSAWEAPVYEVGSRPPVGRFAPPPRLRTSAAGGGRPDRSGSERESGRGFDRASVRGPERSRSQGRPDGRHESRRPPRKENFRENSKGHPREDRAAAEALSAVDNAIQQLERDPSTKFVDLPPTNSFQRRKQHHTINERGFQSQSVGEGDSRAVRVMRGSGA
jgi:hypothetical protein